MATASLNYVAPWWIYWLHNLPHLDLSLKPVDSTFRPEQEDYQQSVVVLACVGAVGLSLSLVLLVLFLVCSRICRRDAHKDVKRPERTRCATWSAVVTALIVCCAVAVGFYGNSETNDGVHRFTYSISNANRTLGGIDSLMADLPAPADLRTAHLSGRLFGDDQAVSEAARHDDGLGRAVCDPELDLTGSQLGYSCGHRRLLRVSRQVYRQPKQRIPQCGPNLPNPFQQSLTVSQRSLTTMQIQIQGLLQFSMPAFPTAEGSLFHAERPVRHPALVECQRIQSAPADSLARLSRTAQGLPGRPNGRMLRWRGRPPLPGFVLPAGGVRALCHAVCHLASVDANRQQVSVTGDKEYDDIDEEDPFNPQARRMSYNARRSNIHSFCSYTSSAGSQASIHPSPQADAAVPPAPEYMNQSMLFGGSPRYENVPLICRGSPPPSYSPGTRTTYLSTTEVQIR
ncbi:protein tweety homolog 2-like isoform X5 [Syngnathus typhle]|uniref:protein tweety homolog 2-like isoform X5 n=1 Tax=Syngnathus typhle TaxID=161592 RepID=UPI002A6B852E|nr:protein tweety homolog 2-like isoform X5 [Syngnathus typhle]